MTLDGRNLGDIKDVVFDSPGISAKVTQIVDVQEEVPKVAVFTTAAPVPSGKKQSATIEVTATKDTEPGSALVPHPHAVGYFEPDAV